MCAFDVKKQNVADISRSHRCIRMQRWQLDIVKCFPTSTRMRKSVWVALRTEPLNVRAILKSRDFKTTDRPALQRIDCCSHVISSKNIFDLKHLKMKTHSSNRLCDALLTSFLSMRIRSAPHSFWVEHASNNLRIFTSTSLEKQEQNSVFGIREILQSAARVNLRRIRALRNDPWRPIELQTSGTS